MERFLALESLKAHNSKKENIFCLHGLQHILVYDLPQMVYLLPGPRNSLALQNLIKLKLVRCEKLEIIFSTSVLRCLPQLLELIIEECKELKCIIEDDVENKEMSSFLPQQTCFPKLQALAVINCNKLKCVFPFSICKELPELKVLVIIEADELEKIFESEGDQKVEIPNLKVVVFVKLPSLCKTHRIQFQAVESRFVHHCQKLCLSSAPTQAGISEVWGYDIGTHYTYLF